MNRSPRPSVIAWLFPLLLAAGAPSAQEFSGGGASVLFGTGSPNTIHAADALARDLDVRDVTGNANAGLVGFYQADRFRLGGAFLAQAWGGVNAGGRHAKDDAAGVAAAIGGLYATYTARHDRVLLNVGGVAGAGRCLVGFSLDDGATDREETVTTFYLGPQVSVGVAACRWFGVEFQLSSPVYFFTDELRLDYGGRTYTVEGSDLAGLQFGMALTMGRIAAP